MDGHLAWEIEFFKRCYNGNEVFGVLNHGHDAPNNIRIRFAC
jgi:hypothetical protein